MSETMGPTITRHIITLTGSVYELVEFAQPEDGIIATLRRLPAHAPVADDGAPSAPMRRDGEPLRVYAMRGVEVGSNAMFVLEPLGDGGCTTRTISVIQSIEHIAPDEQP